MKTTADRLNQIIKERNLKQVDILDLCKPYCEKHNVKLNKNDLSQYISNKYTPRQDKLYILAEALGVNPVWLMGYDVPRGADELKQLEKQLSDEVKLIENIQSYYGENTVELIENFIKLDENDQIRILERIDMLLEDEKYHKKP